MWLYDILNLLGGKSNMEKDIYYTRVLPLVRYEKKKYKRYRHDITSYFPAKVNALRAPVISTSAGNDTLKRWSHREIWTGMDAFHAMDARSPAPQYFFHQAQRKFCKYVLTIKLGTTIMVTSKLGIEVIWWKGNTFWRSAVEKTEIGI